MSSPSAGLVELPLVFGAVLAFGFWELYSLRRDRKRSAQTGVKDETTPPDASGDGA